MSGGVLWDEHDRAVFQATAERGEEGVSGKQWMAYIDHARATVPEERERELKLRKAAIICGEIGFAGRLIREARQNHAEAVEALKGATRCQREAGADADRARMARAGVEAAKAEVKRREGYLQSLQAVQRHLATGNILAAFVIAFSPPLLQTPPQVKAKVNGRPHTYDQRLAAGRAQYLWMEDPKLPVTTVVDFIVEENPAEFGSHRAGLRRHLGKVRKHLLPPR